MTPPELGPLREQIDRIDRALLDLLAERMAVVDAIGAIKRAHNTPMVDPQREAEMLAARAAYARSLGLSDDANTALFKGVLRASHARLGER